MADHRIRVTADTHTKDGKVAQAHVSMIAATVNVRKGDTITWGSKDGPFKITFTSRCPVAGGPAISSHPTRARHQTDTLKVTSSGSFDYVIQVGTVNMLQKSSC